MKNVAFSILALAALVATGCAGSIQPPAERLASSEAAIRSARELGADRDPQAALHVKLASEQVASARSLMADGENRRADMVLQRASADAELAVMITRERSARAEAQKAKSALDEKEGK